MLTLDVAFACNSFSTLEELAELHAFAEEYSSERFWVGGKTDSRGRFSFTDGNSFQPAGLGSAPSQCLGTGVEGPKLMDCGMMMPYICQRC